MEGDELKDPASFRSKYDSDLGTQNARLLLKECLSWILRHSKIDLQSLKGLLADDTFQQIIQVHEQMKKHGFPSIVADYILEFAAYFFYPCLMVPYVYLTGTVPKKFLKTQIGFLKCGSGLPEMMKKFGLLESLTCEERKNGQLVLEKLCSLEVQFTCRYCKLTTDSYTQSSTKGPLHAVSCPRYLPLENKTTIPQQAWYTGLDD